jgi:lysine-N-methylase
LEFDEDEGPPHDPRLGHLSRLRTADGDSPKPYQYFHEIRSFAIWLLQYRGYPLWKRLVILGSFCDELHAMTEAGAQSQTPEVLEGCRDAVHRDLFGEALRNHNGRPAAQLELVLDLIVGRITSDFTPPRFLDCYQQFKQGIEWTSQSTMEEIGQRYALAFSRQYMPFLSGHEHMLEHYLVSYVHRTLFPLGPQEIDRELGAHRLEHSIRDQGLMMMVHYAIVQALLIGIAGLHKDEMSSGLAIQVIQSFTKAFEHSVSFPDRALRTLAAAGVSNCVNLAILIRN